MPRAEPYHHQRQHNLYHSQFTGAHYLNDAQSASSMSPPLSPASASQYTTPSPGGAPAAPAAKKKHVCSVCDRAFTTSGHLARHSRVHTGERNHKCPFPGCETRCSRQDNLQQHYRIHLSPGSRRSSARTTGRGSRKAAAASAAATTTAAPPSAPSPVLDDAPSSPPPLEQARLYSHHSTPPDSPPPLAHATLPATATLPLSLSSASDRGSAHSSPDTGYTAPHHLLAQAQGGQGYASYRAASYQDQQPQGSTSAGFHYVGSSYGTQDAGGYVLQQQQRGPSPQSISSRHSISHISHPQTSYGTQSTAPGSPASASSRASGPSTPTYPVFHDDNTAYHHSSTLGMGHQQHHQQQQQHHHQQAQHQQQQQHHQQVQHQQQQQQQYNSYPSSLNTRFESPPPILAPIQDVRVIRHRDERVNLSLQSAGTNYMHHPQPMNGDSYGYQGMGLGHGAWKNDANLRKGVGALV